MNDDDDQIEHQTADFIGMRFILFAGNQSYALASQSETIITIKYGAGVRKRSAMKVSRLDALSVLGPCLADMGKHDIL